MNNKKQQKTFDSFFKTEYNKLLNFVRKNMEDRYFDASPEDVVQDVAFSLLSKFDVDTQIENLAAYFYKSIKNKLIDIKRKPQNKVSLENYSSVQQDNILNKSEWLDSNENEFELKSFDKELIHDAIKRLNPNEQALIMATEFDGQTFNELSDKWNIPIGTLLSRKHRALSKLYNFLNETK